MNFKRALIYIVPVIIIISMVFLSFYLYKGLFEKQENIKRLQSQENQISQASQGPAEQKSTTSGASEIKSDSANTIAAQISKNVDKEKKVIDWASEKKDALPVLMYHAIDNNVFGEKEMFVANAAFASQMKYLYDKGYTPIDISEIRNYTKYKKPIIITFDDGYEDNYTNAYPILKKYNFKATIFLVSGFIGKANYLKAEQIKQMEDIISFQSHTVNHIMLGKSDIKTVEKECAQSKEQIEKLTAKAVYAIAYPFGSHNNGTIAIAKKYYTYGINSSFGYFKMTTGNFDIKRVGVSYLDTVQEFAKRI